MKYNKNWKVEFCWESCSPSYRYYYWRIAGEELNFFQRIFSNPWYKFQIACYDKWNQCIDIEDYYKYVQPIKTYGDIVAFREQEWEKIKKKRQELIDRGVVFPDKYD